MRRSIESTIVSERQKNNVAPWEHFMYSTNGHKKNSYNTERYMLEDVTNGKKSLKCLFCGDQFKYDAKFTATPRERLRKHIVAIHFKVKQYGCHLCSSKFKSPACLKRHVNSVHLKLKPFKCEICGKCFAAMTTLRIHLTTHDEKGLFKCTICGKYIRHKTTFQDHMNMHTGEAQYTCAICEKGFIYKKSFRDHLLLHSSQYSNKCSVCNKLFKGNAQQRKHERSHSTMYQCTICYKILSTQRSLKAHVKNIHYNDGNKDRLFLCSHCNARFQRESHLKNHIYQLHTLTIFCHHCKATFANKARLKYHIVKVHGVGVHRPWKCNLCDKHFIKESHVKRHMSTHNNDIPSVDLSCK